jgi:hypothetical protein
VQIYVLALYTAVYPTLLAAVAIMLGHPRRYRLLSAFLLSGIAVSVGCGIGIVLLIHSSGAVKRQNSGWSWGTDLVVGALALLLALALATHAWQRLLQRRRGHRQPRGTTGEGAAPAADPEPWSQRLLARGSVPIVVAASVALNVPGAVYLVALKDIAAGHHSVPIELVLVLVFNLIMFLLAEIPWVGLMIAPERTERLVARASGFLARHGNRIATVVCVVVGLHLIIRGAVHS